jgi:hypothetical protein
MARPSHLVPARRRFVNVILLIAALIAVAVWVVAIRMLTGPVELSRPGTPQAIVWRGRVYTSQSALAAAFKARGLSYSAWARHHPAAVSIVTHRPVAKTVSAQRKPKIVTSKHRVASSRHKTAAAPTNASPQGGDRRPFTVVLLWAFAFLLGAVAVAPSRVLAKVSIREIGPDQRMIIGCMAASVVVGLLAASLG